MRQRPSLLVATLVVATVVIAACSNGPAKLSAREQTFANAFAKDLSAKDGFGVDAKGGKCIGDAIMRELGTAPFDKAKVTTKDIGGDKSPGELLGKGTVTNAQAEKISKAWQKCVDLPKLFASQGSDQYKLDAKGQTCFEGKLRKSTVLDQYLKVSFTSDKASDSQTVVQEIVKLVQACSTTGGQGGVLVDSIATSLSADGTLTTAQARCMAQKIVDDIGANRLLDATKGGNGLSGASPQVQAEFEGAIVKAAGGCNVSLSELNG
jgi:hypothetical protein